jgi:RNA polymerase sigma-70 factor (ECF subfamily)
MTCGHQTLLQALREGRPEAFEELYLEFYELLFFQAFRMLGDEFMAKDLVHDVFLKFLELKQFYQVHTSLESFLFVTVHNQCKAYLKKEKAIKGKKQQYSQDIQSVSGPADDSAYVQQKESSFQQSIEHLQSSFSELSPMQQEAFRLVHFERMSYQDAAEAMGANFYTFRTQLFRAVKALRSKVNRKKLENL